MSEYVSTMRSYENVLDFCSKFFLPSRSFNPIYAFALRLLELLRFHHIVFFSLYTSLNPKTSSARCHPRKDRHSPRYFGRFTSKQPPICTKISSFQNIRTRLHQQMRLHRPCNDEPLLLNTCYPEASEMAYQVSAFLCRSCGLRGGSSVVRLGFRYGRILKGCGLI